MTHWLVAATANPAKVAELRRVVGSLAAVSPPPDDISPQIEESGSTVEAVAEAKATAWSRTLDSGALVVATDGGLLIPALGASWDPVRTRRFAPAAASDDERAAALLNLAAHLDGEERRIGWREAMAVARDGDVLVTWSAEGPPGFLAETVDAAAIAAGAGFWVPAIWRCPEFGGRLLAYLSPAERATRRDHWTVLGERLRAFLSEEVSAAEGSTVVGE